MRPQPRKPWQVALEKARKALGEREAVVVAAMSGARYEAGIFRLPFFQELYLVHYPQGTILGQDGQPPKEHDQELLLLHYLLTADGTPIHDQWVSYRELPGGYFAGPKFLGQSTIPLARAFGRDLEGFSRACLALGGTTMSRTGDAAFRFLALPQVPLACILYLGEDDLPASTNILFDASASHYLPTDDLFHLGIQLAETLLGRRGA